MALYKPDNFTDDITVMLKIDHSEAVKLKDTLLKNDGKKEKPVYELVDKEPEWESFNADMKDLLTSFMNKLQPGFSLPAPDISKVNSPDINKAKTFEEILAYLDYVKGKNREDNLKSYILNSQNEEKYNYFARIFDLWYDKNMKPKMKEAFLCCYAEVLLTQQLTQPMLNFIISTFAKVYKGGIDKSLNVQLSRGEFINEITERSSFLHLIYAITFVYADDDKDDNDNKETASKRINEILSLLSVEGFNPKSFLDVTYYYAIVNMLSFQELESMLRNTAKLVIINLFGDDMSDVAESFSKNNTLSEIEGFLDFNKASIEQLHKYPGLELDENKMFDSIKDKDEDKKGVNYFNGNVITRGTDTFNFSQFTVDPKMDVYSDQYILPEELCEWMAKDRHFYESYYDIESKTRAESVYGNVTPYTPDSERDYAYLIVHKDLLSGKIGSVNGIGKLWKDDFRGITDEKQRIKDIKKFFEESFERISDALESDNLRKDYSKIDACMQFNTLVLAEAVNNELKREKSAVYDKDLALRSEYLLKVFQLYSIKNDQTRASDFENKLSIFDEDDEDIDEQLLANRWPPFSSLRYQDAMLYMCLNSDDPEGMFNKINNTAGYDYFQRKKVQKDK
ncbi:MAG: hypothetical protein K6C68_05065 [Ruminococcus sp.]|nr:hypothetical protein [Ruminococcus sp.]